MELYHLKKYIDDLLHRAVGPIGPTITGVQLHFLPASRIFLILSEQLLLILILLSFYFMKEVKT